MVTGTIEKDICVCRWSEAGRWGSRAVTTGEANSAGIIGVALAPRPRPTWKESESGVPPELVKCLSLFGIAQNFVRLADLLEVFARKLLAFLVVLVRVPLHRELPVCLGAWARRD